MASGNQFAAPGEEASLSNYFHLLKPRVMSLAIFTALVGMVVAPGGMHPTIALASILCIAAGAGAAGALNMWWDADIDRHMARTARRPVAAGHIMPGTSRDIGLGLAALSSFLLALFANPLAGGLLALAILHYVVVYTILLKRRTSHSVVIGGIAGALPPVIGYAVTTGSVSWEAMLMFGVIFLWTPPHSWALALACRSDYACVSVPMLPVVAGRKATVRQIQVYTLLTVLVGIALASTEVGGPLSVATAVLLGGLMLQAAWAIGRKGGGQQEEWRLFGISIFYLFSLFLSILVETVLYANIAGYDWPAF